MPPPRSDNDEATIGRFKPWCARYFRRASLASERNLALSSSSANVQLCAFGALPMYHRAGDWPLNSASGGLRPFVDARSNGEVAPLAAGGN